MSSKQIQVLRYFDRRKAMSLLVAGQWIWRQEIMHDRRLADEICNLLGL